MDHVFFTQSSVGRYLGCFYQLALVNNAAVHIDVQVSLRDPAFISLGCRPTSGTGVDPMTVLFIFGGTSILMPPTVVEARAAAQLRAGHRTASTAKNHLAPHSRVLRQRNLTVSA